MYIYIYANIHLHIHGSMSISEDSNDKSKRVVFRVEFFLGDLKHLFPQKLQLNT